MDNKEIRRRSPVDRRNTFENKRKSLTRSVSPRNNPRRHNKRRSSPSRRVYHEYRTPERRDRAFRRERHQNDRENPEESRCLGVFGMSTHTNEENLRDVFSPFGQIEKLQIIYDTKTNQSRGYSFIYYTNIEDAKEAKKQCNNLEINGKTIRVDFSVTKRAHSPTPGVYMGKQNYNNYNGRDRYERNGSYRRNDRTSGRTYSRYRPRSRSYSRSPRR